jgi:endonuclease G
VRVALTLALAPAVAFAGGPDRPVIGGSNAPAGKWPDAAAILYTLNGTEGQECSGTLVAPTVVLTAGHCDPAVSPDIGQLTHVLVGTNSLAHPEDGETLPVASVKSYPNSQSSVDISVIVLAHPSTVKPRPIATGWARLDIQNGAAVEFVGYGAIDRNALMYINELQQAQSTITDFDCTTSSGCNSAAKPDGELGAGGNGIDTCPGDSGGPAYLLVDYGIYLAGVTSRSYDNATVACSQGGIYERPDKVVDWIEQTGGTPVARGPEPVAEPIMAVAGGPGETQIHVNDPRSTGHDFVITKPPASGAAAVRDDGRVRVCTTKPAGADSFVVTITDRSDSSRAIALPIDIVTMDGTAPASCDVTAFAEDGGGCCDSGRSSRGSIPLAIAVLGIVRRKRRRRDHSGATR